jgi:hypothetical protein
MINLTVQHRVSSVERRAFQCRASSVERSNVERRAFQCRVSSVPVSSVECSNVERQASLSRPSMVFLALNVNSPVLLLQLPSPLTSLPSPDAAASGVHRSCRSGSTTIRRIPHRQDRASDARRHHVHGNPNLSLRPPATHSIGSISNTMPPPLVLPRGHGQVCRVRSPLELSTSRHSSITSPVLSTSRHSNANSRRSTRFGILDATDTATLQTRFSPFPSVPPCPPTTPLLIYVPSVPSRLPTFCLLSHPHMLPPPLVFSALEQVSPSCIRVSTSSTCNLQVIAVHLGHSVPPSSSPQTRHRHYSTSALTCNMTH